MCGVALISCDPAVSVAVKAWFSGHFHLGQDYEDSITFPTVPREMGPYPNRGSCVFAQTSVMRSGTSRGERDVPHLCRAVVVFPHHSLSLGSFD